MEEVLQEKILEALLQTNIPSLLGPGKIFYRGAIRDTTFPYLCYNLELSTVEGMPSNFMQDGELIFDIWTRGTTNDLTHAVAKTLKNTFNHAYIEADGVAALRCWYQGQQEAPVENNRSNRRSEDEYMFRREVNFYVRGWDRDAQANQPVIEGGLDFFDPNDERYGRRIVVPAQVPNGIRTQFTLPTRARRILYYTLNGVRYEDFTREGLNVIVLPTAPASGVNLAVAYVAG